MKKINGGVPVRTVTAISEERSNTYILYLKMQKMMNVPLFYGLLILISKFRYGPWSGTLEIRIQYRIRKMFRILVDLAPDPQHWNK
jgi:hypothetical protein